MRALVLSFACLLGASSVALGIDTVDLGQSPPPQTLSWTSPGSGTAVLGDFNGDGLRDYALTHSVNNVDKVFVVFGPATGQTTADLLSQGQGFTISDTDSSRYNIARTLANMGDVNGDGRDDLFVATTSFTTVADAFIVYGKTGGDLDLASFGASDGVRIRHSNPFNPVYLRASAFGDANGDGLGDLAFSNFSSEPKGNLSGSAWVVFGRQSWPALIDLDALAADGYRIDGPRLGAQFGSALGAAGDVNGDGADDIIVASSRARSLTLGSVYVIYGKASTATIDTAALGTAGMRIDGPGRIGGNDPESVEGVGDLNGDGRDDVAVTCVECGKGWVVFGSPSNATLDLAQLGTRGWSVSGRYQALSRVHQLGDVNGDGQIDVGFASPDWSEGAAPGSYLVVTDAEAGGAYGLYDGSLDGRAFLIRGSFNYEYVGLNAFGVPDATGDGVRDILLSLTDSGGTGQPARLVTVSGAGLATGPTDTQPPTIQVSQDPDPNAADWNNTPVTVGFSCADETQLVFCTSPVTLSDEGAGQVVTGTAEDAAGNTATAQASVNIDLTAPQISCPEAPEYAVGQEALLVGSVSDSLSGALSSNASAAPDTSVPGSFSVELSASDVAGNSATVTCAYTVAAAGFTVSDVFATGNIAPPPTVNTVKAGRVIPVRWTLHDENGQPVSDPSSFVSITSGATQCGAADPTDAYEVESSNSGLQYIGDGTWQFNWKTSSSFSGQCRVMRLNLANGQTGGFALFQFS